MTRKKKPAPPPAPTREALLRAIGEKLDAAEQVLARLLPKLEHALDLRYPPTALREVRGQLAVLTGQLEEIENPEGQWDHPGAEAAIRQALAHPAGEVPGWTRPGQFLRWVGNIPVLCRWGGFAYPSAELLAVSPAHPFLNASGWLELSPQAQRNHGVADGFDAVLRSIVARPEMRLSPLSREGHEAASETAKAEWIAEALRRGPVNAVALPTRMRATQMALFG